MEKLDALYRQLLMVGFVVLRQALDANDREWAEAELELLHNVPSLLNDPNIERHRYFWFTERERYIAWLSVAGHEKARSRMRTYYEPLWQEMEPALLEALSVSVER